MIATDELCQLLEERNEEYDIRDNSGGRPSYVLVGWYFNLADRAYFYGYPDGRTKLITYRCTYDLDPEQAIAATLGRDRYSYKQWREISNAVGDAMEYAHDKAIECPDKADPLWNLDEYVSRILKAAFEGEATLGDTDATAERHGGAGTCHDIGGCRWFRCSACGFGIEDMYVNDEGEYPPADQPRYCPNCGRRIVDPTTNDVDAEVDA